MTVIAAFPLSAFSSSSSGLICSWSSLSWSTLSLSSSKSADVLFDDPNRLKRLAAVEVCGFSSLTLFVSSSGLVCFSSSRLLSSSVVVDVVLFNEPKKLKRLFVVLDFSSLSWITSSLSSSLTTSSYSRDSDGFTVVDVSVSSVESCSETSTTSSFSNDVVIIDVGSCPAISSGDVAVLTVRSCPATSSSPISVVSTGIWSVSTFSMVVSEDAWGSVLFLLLNDGKRIDRILNPPNSLLVGIVVVISDDCCSPSPSSFSFSSKLSSLLSITFVSSFFSLFVLFLRSSNVWTGSSLFTSPSVVGPCCCLDCVGWDSSGVFSPSSCLLSSFVVLFVLPRLLNVGKFGKVKAGNLNPSGLLVADSGSSSPSAFVVGVVGKETSRTLNPGMNDLEILNTVLVPCDGAETSTLSSFHSSVIISHPILMFWIKKYKIYFFKKFHCSVAKCLLFVYHHSAVRKLQVLRHPQKQPLRMLKRSDSCWYNYGNCWKRCCRTRCQLN